MASLACLRKIAEALHTATDGNLGKELNLTASTLSDSSLDETLGLAVPSLRAVELHRHTHNGEPYVQLYDPLALSTATIMLPEGLAAILVFFDGQRTPVEIAQAFESHFGATLPPRLIAELVAALDECLLLNNARAQAALTAHPVATNHVATNGQRPDTRPMTIAGAGYPDRAEALRPFLNAYLPASTNGHSPHATVQPAEPVGLLSPHIDYARGGAIYGEVWSQAARAAQAADAVVIFATDHYGYDLFTLTRQHYATPYGVLPTDAPLTAALAGALGEERAFAGELRHRREHSVELVAVWLHHMRGGQACPIVPILCGSPYQQIAQGIAPTSLEPVQAVLETLATHMADRRILVVASGDLAHVGPAFRGKPLDRTARATLRAADEELLAHMTAGNADGFFKSIAAVQDRNNVCGVMPIYLTMKLLERTQDTLRGQVTGYASCPADAHNTSAVTIAGVTFH